MASTTRKQPAQGQPGISRYFLPIETFKEARNLAGRLQGSDVFRHYVKKRMRLVLPALVLFLAISVACTAASIVFVAGARSGYVLLAIVFSPFILAGSLFVQMHVFFSWLEGRALARAYPHSKRPEHGAAAAWLAKKLKADLGAAPRIPWGFAAIFLFAPLALLVLVSAKFALALIAAAILLPILYSRLDRR